MRGHGIRIKAAVIAAPAFGFAFANTALKKVRISDPALARGRQQPPAEDGCAPPFPTRLSIVSSLAPAITTSCRRAVRDAWPR
jgi:predicted dienelactone hydrolase